MFEDMEFGYDNIPGFKLGLHIAQILFSFVCWCLEIAVFKSQDAEVNGRNGWTFAVCFLSIPAWIYLIGAPRFPRTRKIAHPYAMAALDIFYTILWISAFATQAAYNSANSCGQGCNLSKAVVGIAFFVVLFFIGTSTLSIFTLRYWQANSRLPGYDKYPATMGGQNIDPDKAAFSMAPHDEEAYAPVNMNDQDQHNELHSGYGYGETSYGSGGGPSQDPFQQEDPYNRRPSPAGRPELNPFDDHNEYGSQTQPGRYNPPTAQDDYEDNSHGPAAFPAGNYDRGLH